MDGGEGEDESWEHGSLYVWFSVGDVGMRVELEWEWCVCKNLHGGG